MKKKRASVRTKWRKTFSENESFFFVNEVLYAHRNTNKKKRSWVCCIENKIFRSGCWFCLSFVHTNFSMFYISDLHRLLSCCYCISSASYFSLFLYVSLFVVIWCLVGSENHMYRVQHQILIAMDYVMPHSWWSLVAPIKCASLFCVSSGIFVASMLVISIHSNFCPVQRIQSVCAYNLDLFQFALFYSGTLEKKKENYNNNDNGPNKTKTMNG